MAVSGSCRGGRRSANRDDNCRIDLTDGIGVAARHVDGDDLPRQRIETIYGIAHSHNTGKPKDSGCNPAGMSSLGIDFVNGAGNDGSSRTGVRVDLEGVEDRVELAAKAEQVRVED